MNPPNKAGTLRLYALGLLLVGLASIFYNAKEGLVQLHPEGKTGLIANGIGAVLALIFSVFAAKGKDWAHWAGIILAFLFLIIGFKNGFVTARGVSSHLLPEHLWYKAALFGATGAVSLLALMPLMIYMRRERRFDPASAE